MGIVAALGVALAPGAASALDAELGEVRVACEVTDEGRLSNCAPLSRVGDAPWLDQVALQAAGYSRMSPSQGTPTGRIHFPVRFTSEAEYEQMMATPPPPLVVRMPGPRDDDSPATVPAVPAGFEGQAWGGLTCVITPSAQIRLCWQDGRRVRRGLLGGKLVYFAPMLTSSGTQVDEPRDLPARPSEVFEQWTRAELGEYGDTYVKTISRSGDMTLVWSVHVIEGSRETSHDYRLMEYDCTGNRRRAFMVARGGEEGLTGVQQADSALWWPVGDEGLPPEEDPAVIVYRTICSR
ncbi:energy transducer TonB family protein [Brevundimonas lenta]|uniref:TonB C-terminal domain-containing protein n=1 Tax=Brevundimonas lenta TaxID=424796 RepID=A0A7W6JCN6_9CAUL|nr:energy transducer TonB [Brevundimonas lenta]MBB4081732.1 hypothetical protein [Brevundimonas lenta]